MTNTQEEQPQQEEAQTEKLKKEIEDEKKRAEDYLARLKYVQADFENLKKRTDRQIAEVKEYCTEPLVIELLEIVDELEMAVKAGRNCNSAKSMTQGVEMTLNKLKRILENQQVFPIECVGKPFDPLKYTAIAKIERDDVEECTVIEEIRKGYIMKEKVIRPSVVKVAIRPESKSQEEVEKNE
jgi:molecular chaperone GrpE